MEIAFERQEMVSRDPISIATFWVMRDFDIALSALPDVARVPNLKMAATKTGSGNNS
jgi:hypothetical protein